MSKQIHVWPQPPRSDGETLVVSALLDYSSDRRETLWFRVPYAWCPALIESADPFVIATVFPAMQAGASLHIHGYVSPSLLANLEEFQTIWHRWAPKRYQVVAVSAESEHEALATNVAESVACFSGGVDASFTVYRHTKGYAGRQRKHVRAALMVHGFDIPLTDDRSFSLAASRAEATLDSLSVPLIRVSTNWRQLGVDWEDGHAAACSACLALFQGKFSSGLLASTDPYEFISPWGSHPLTDVRLSSTTFQIIHDGAGYSRTEKVSGLAAWPEAIDNLRVCWEGPDPSRNCGVCEKCVRTILNFRAAGVPLPSCFPADVTDAQIAHIPIRNTTQANELKSILDYARRHGSRDALWVHVLDQRIRRVQRKGTLWARLRHRVENVLAR